MASNRVASTTVVNAASMEGRGVPIMWKVVAAEVKGGLEGQNFSCFGAFVSEVDSAGDSPVIQNCYYSILCYA